MICHLKNHPYSVTRYFVVFFSVSGSLGDTSVPMETKNLFVSSALRRLTLAYLFLFITLSVQ